MGCYSVLFYNHVGGDQTPSANSQVDFNSLTIDDALYPVCEAVKDSANSTTNSYVVTLASFTLHKQVYHAGKLELTFQVADVNAANNDASTLTEHGDAVYEKFKSYKSLRLQYHTFSSKSSVPSTTINVLTHYVIFNCRRIVKASNTSYTIVVTAYSPDRLLCIDKFNRSFTGKKLGSDLAAGYLSAQSEFLNACDSNTNLSLYKQCGVDIIYNLNNLSYTTKEQQGDKEVEVIKEALLPYTVQFNESVWDFLVRIASRNGEFLYYENDAIRVGLPAQENSKQFSDHVNDNAYVFDSMEDNYSECYGDASTMVAPDYLNSEESAECTKATHVGTLYNSECIISPEVNELVQKTDFSSVSDYVQHIRFAFDQVGLVFSESSLLDAFTGMLVDVEMSYAAGEVFVDSDNKKYYGYYFPKKDKETDKEPTTDALRDEKAQANSEDFYLFASSLKLLSNSFYHGICKDAEYSRKNLMTFKFSQYVDVQLGDLIKYNNKKYRVWSIAIEKNTCTVQVIPVVELNQTAHYNPSDSSYVGTTRCIPIIDATKRVVKTTSQRAIVVDTYDPLQLGRVRVRYPWQYEENEPSKDTYAGNKYNDVSPWLRIVLPMASNGAGFMFMPNVNDEVMIDYEDGNVDRPYVCGAMYSINHAPAYHASTQMCGKVKSICTNNGHHIAFTDKVGDVRMFARMIPFWSKLSKFGQCNIDIDKELLRQTTGGFEIADYLGIYSISGSSENRSVSISSPLGNVSISALTGISINAPLGDVSIVGKNVSIEARNNLSIKSGTNMYNRIWDLKKNRDVLGSPKAALVDAAKGLTGLDFKFIRCMFEAVLKPVGGALAIKSNRYISIASGDGSAVFDDAEMVDNMPIGVQVPHVNQVDDNKLSQAISKYNACKNQLELIILQYNSIKKAIIACNGLVSEFDTWNVQNVIIEGETYNGKSAICKKLYNMLSAMNRPIGSIFFSPAMSDLHIRAEYFTVYCKATMLQERIRVFIDDLTKSHQAIASTTKTIINNLKECDKYLEAMKKEGKYADLKILTNLTGKSMLYDIMAECFVDFLNFDKTHPNTYDVASLKKKISIGDGHNIMSGVGSFLGFKGFLDDRSWSAQTKGGIMISNSKGKAYTLKDGVFRESTKDSLLNKLINDLGSFQNNQNAE